jgi:cytochrome P450
VTVSVHELDLPEIDMDAADRAQLRQVIADARARHWLARNPLGFTVTRYEDVSAILRDRRWHSALSMIPAMAGLADRQWPERRKSILSMEGEEHTRLRRLVSPAFTPASADRLRPFMRQVVTGLVDRVAHAGRCDLVADICEPYPIPIVCELLGAPKQDWKLFSAWASDIFRIFNQNLVEDLPIIERASAELDAYVTDMIHERRDHPADDLLSQLIAVEEQGDRLATEELVMLVEAVLMAGTDTTRNQLGCSVALLAERPEQWARLAAHPEISPKVVEETMRYLGAVRGTARFASEDIEYRGVMFPAGTLVATSLAGANFDPAVFTSPDTFDLDRDGAQPQMTFGSGIHFCLGAALARAELQEALPVLARRMPELALDGEIEWKPQTFGIWGPARLPLRFTAGA